MHAMGSWWLWTGFIVFILCLLAVDLLVLSGQRKQQVSIKQALGWTIFWVTLALLFNVFLWWYVWQHHGLSEANQKALTFFTGYILEKSLSIDNLFVFLLIFDSFSVPEKYQRQVLFQGVIGAIIMRAIMIVGGIYLIEHFSWLFYFLGFLLIITASRMLFVDSAKKNITETFLIRFLYRYLPLTQRYYGKKYFVRLNGVLYFTPLFLVLILIELSDLIFAIDSIPAIFGITTDSFIVFSSNIFAILGLRAMYFLLAKVAYRFYLLKYGIAVILIFIGIKMIIAHWVTIPIFACISFIAIILAISIAFSWRKTANKNR
jgi:tellurite resistance protein TerC